MEYRYCPICGGELRIESGTYPACPSGHFTLLPWQNVGVAAVVSDGKRVGAPRGGTLKKSDESLDMAWFSYEDIPWAEMAFPRHAAALQEWISGSNAEGV